MSGGGPDGIVYSITPAQDDSGDVYVGGVFTSVNGTAVGHLVRLHHDGSVDSGFDMSGGGVDGIVYSITPAQDGSGDVFVGGEFASVNGVTTDTLARLGPDGSVD
jgi:hypothetical protein